MAPKSNIKLAHSRAVGGQRKRCQIGKNCSAACIERNDTCLVEIPLSPTKAVSQVRGLLQEEGKTRSIRVSAEIRDARKKELYGKVQESLKGIRFDRDGQDKWREEYNKAREGVISFNKAIVRQGQEGKIDLIRVPISYDRLLEVKQNFLKARDETMGALSRTSDFYEFEKLERRLKAINDKYATRLGYSPLEKEWYDIRAEKTWINARREIESDLVYQATRGNKRKYDSLEARYLDLMERGKRFPRLYKEVQKGSVWEKHDYERELHKRNRYFTSKRSLVAELEDAAYSGDLRKYNRLEAKILAMQSRLGGKFSDNDLITKGQLWDKVALGRKATKYRQARDSLLKRMQKAAAERNRRKYQILENRLLKIQDEYHDKLKNYLQGGLPKTEKGYIWRQYRMGRFTGTSNKLMEQMTEAADKGDRRLYDKLERRYMVLTGSQYYKMLGREPYEKGDVWSTARRDFRKRKYMEVRDKLMVDLRQAIIDGDRRAYDKVEDKLESLKKAARKFNDYDLVYANQGEMWDNVARTPSVLAIQRGVGKNVNVSYDPYEGLITLDSEVRGERLKVKISRADMTFKVNDSYEADPDLPKYVRMALIRETTRQFNAVVPALQTGMEFEVYPYDRDGGGNRRTKAYKGFGFSDPDKDGYMYARVVENGGVKKLTPSDKEDWSDYHKDREDDDYDF